MDVPQSTPNAYAKILDADLRNIIKKAAAGKPLSPSEHARVVARAAGCDDSVTTAKTVVELATLLGTSRRQITRWQKLSGAPQPNANRSKLARTGRRPLMRDSPTRPRG